MAATKTGSREQWMDALQRANEVRAERKQLFEQLNAGEKTFADLFEEPALQNAEIGKLLLRKEKVGKKRVRLWLGQAGISDLQASQRADRQPEAAAARATVMNDDDKSKKGIEVNVSSPSVQAGAMSPYQVAIALLYMSCRRCGFTMERGTQCHNCGAWCR